MSSLEDFRRETRAWLDANCPAAMRTPMLDNELVWGGRTLAFRTEDQRLWFERMRDKGWFCPDWPVEYGGGGLSPEQNAVLEAEMRRLRCRPPQINLGIWMLGPVVLEFCTEEQKRALLPPMARGEIRWCQGFSEPNAGSDLASLKTSAVDAGDHFIVNGTKIWTSYGDKSDWMYMLVRTDPASPKQQGISLLVVDMDSPGIEARPIDLISGKSSFCQVFFDNVKVPKRQLIGPLNGGWTLAKALLQHERRAMSKFGEFSLPTHFDLLSIAGKYLPSAASSSPADMVLRQRVFAMAMDEMAYSLTVQRMGEQARAGSNVSGLMSIMKLVHSEQEKDKFEVLVDVLGHRALGWEGDAFEAQELSLTKAWLGSFAQTIAGGSSEVQLNVIAKRVLELPEGKQGGQGK